MEEKYELRCDCGSFSGDLSFLVISNGVAPRSKTNSEICQLFKRLVRLKIYIFSVTDSLGFINKNIFFEGAFALWSSKRKKTTAEKNVSTEKANEHSFAAITIVLKSPKEIQTTKTTKKKHIKQLSDFSLWMQRGKKTPPLSSCSLSILTRFGRFLLNKKYVIFSWRQRRKTCTQNDSPREGKICQGTMVS